MCCGRCCWRHCSLFAAYKLIALSISGTLAISEVGHWALIALLGVAVQTIGYLASTSTSHSVAYHTLENLRNAACKHLAACSLGDVQSAPSGALKKIIIDDIEQMELPIAHVIPEFTSNVLLLILCFAIVCSIDIRLALSMLIAPACQLCPFRFFLKTLNETMQRTGQQVSALTQHSSNTSMESKSSRLSTKPTPRMLAFVTTSLNLRN